MADDTKPAKGKKAEDAKPAEEPKVEEVTKTDEAPEAPPAPDDAAAQPAQTDPTGRQMFDITCSSCNKPAQVPFKPSGDRPVYCRDCYMKQRRS